MKQQLLILFLLFGVCVKAQQIIPFSHDNYAKIERHLAQKNQTLHSAVKPYLQHEVEQEDSLCQNKDFLDFSFKNKALKYLLNNHLIYKKGDAFEISIDPIVDFKLGYSGDMSIVNTRGFWTKGTIGNKITFQSTFHETQAKYANYVNQWAVLNGVIPGQGAFKGPNGEGVFDFQWSGGFVSYQPSTYFNIQFGHGKHFFGDGYRSLLLSDNAVNYPYLKITTSVWKLKYVNLYGVYQNNKFDVFKRPGGPPKYASTHFLSWNITSRWNVNVFETVVWYDSLGVRGFDVQYLNPIIFFRPVEFSIGSPDNAILGAGTKFKITDQTYTYGQIVLDEFKASEVFAGNKWWANKFGMQLGIRSFDLFKVEGLSGQLEYNIVRPYTYAHRSSGTNYAHFSQALAHPLGANFSETLAVLRYQKKRWNANLTLLKALKGYDDANASYGGDIYKSYYDRPKEYGHVVGQGVAVNVRLMQASIAYIINPSYNLQFEFNFTSRRQSSSEASFDKVNENYFQFGLRTNLFTHYHDF